MILVGLDDTDVPDSRGTNQLAKLLVARLSDQYRCLRIVRHQLLVDHRIPFTSKNGSASLWLECLGMNAGIESLMERLRTEILREFIPGSDPGVCVTDGSRAASVISFGRRCKAEVVSLAAAEATAREQGVRLEGLGGTRGGMIGALAAVGLAATADDGRVVYWHDMECELSGIQPLSEIARRNVTVQHGSNGSSITEGSVDVGKKLRPNLVNGRHVLFVQPHQEMHSDRKWVAQKRT